MKKFSIIIFFSLVAFSASHNCFSQTEVSIGCLIGENLTRTKEIRYFILSDLDTIFRSKESDLAARRSLYDTLSIDNPGIYKLIFQHFDGETRKQVEYSFNVDGKEALVQIFLYFSLNSFAAEYLKDLTVSKFYSPSNVQLIDAWDKKAGSRPLYKIVNNSDTTFYGVSETSHFYGKILCRKESFWMVNSGSYCGTTADERPLSKGTWVYSFVPAFSESKEYRIKEKGEYRYVVTLGLQKYSSQIPVSLTKSAATRKRTLIFFELEDRFFIM